MWIHLLFISLIVAALIINYLVWFKNLSENVYEKWGKHWMSENEFYFSHKGGAIVFLLGSIGLYIQVLICH